MGKIRQLENKVDTILEREVECEASDPTPRNESCCKEGWTKLGDSCYIDPPGARGWEHARDFCRGTLFSHLAVFESREEMDAVRQAFRYVYYWVSAIRRDDGQFYWEKCAVSSGQWACQYTPVDKDWW